MIPPRRTTIKDIARTAGVSTAAVSQALRPHPKSNIKLPPETVERIKEVARQLDYQAHSGARSIRSNSFGTIGYFAARTGLLPDLVALDRGNADWIALSRQVLDAEGSQVALRALRARVLAVSPAWMAVPLPRDAREVSTQGAGTP